MNRFVSQLAVSLLGIFLLLASFQGVTSASGQENGFLQGEASRSHDDGTVEPDSEHSHVSLTEKQKKRLAEIHRRLYEDHVKLIELYAEYGLITEQAKQKKLKRLEEHYKRKQQNDYLPCWHKKGEKPRESDDSREEMTQKP